MAEQAARLKITEIFHSLQGEGEHSGWPTVFVRLTGCPLRCNYCDTEYAFTGGQWQELDEIVAQVVAFNTPRVTVTGGEPLAQKTCLSLLQKLCEAGLWVSLETSGAISVADVDRRVQLVLDLKTPSSGEQQRNLLENIQYLRKSDQLKFVMADRADFDWAVQLLQQYCLTERCQVLFSPVHGKLEMKTLALWILDAAINVRMQLQLHKFVWGDEPGH